MMSVKEHSAQLVDTIYPQPLSLAALTRLLRSLLADGIPLNHPLPIFSSLSGAVLHTLDHDALIDLVRADLGPLIIGQAYAPDQKVPVITLDARLEDMILQGMRDGSGQPVIEPELARTIGEHVATLVAQRDPGAGPLALIVQAGTRRAMAALLRLRAPSCLVLSIAELPPTQPIEVVAVVGAESDPQALDAPQPNTQAESMAA
jgi:flagellar biosynthesis protein FlhA